MLQALVETLLLGGGSPYANYKGKVLPATLCQEYTHASSLILLCLFTLFATQTLLMPGVVKRAFTLF
jgi:hypothetical protein